MLTYADGACSYARPSLRQAGRAGPVLNLIALLVKKEKSSDAEGAARILPKLKAAGHRVLIYSQMVQLLEILAEYIEGEGYIYRQLIGSTASEVRL